jgi:hypothetical protein
MQPQQPNGQVPGNPQMYPSYQGPPVPVGGLVPGAFPGQVPLSSKPSRRHHRGFIISIIVLTVLWLSTIGVAIWAYASMMDYKNNSDQKSAKAVAIAVQKEDSKKDKEFLEKEKQPLKTYLGPETYGGLNLQYPKTWSAFITQSDKTVTPIDGYFYPNVVPGIQSGTEFALRVQVSSQSYDQEMKILEGKVKSGKLAVAPVVLPNVPGVNGSRITGEVNQGQKDVLILLPLRDKTLKIWTETPEFLNDFDRIILANLKFNP